MGTHGDWLNEEITEFVEVSEDRGHSRVDRLLREERQITQGERSGLYLSSSMIVCTACPWYLLAVVLHLAQWRRRVDLIKRDWINFSSVFNSRAAPLAFTFVGRLLNFPVTWFTVSREVRSFHAIFLCKNIHHLHNHHSFSSTLAFLSLTLSFRRSFITLLHTIQKHTLF